MKKFKLIVLGLLTLASCTHKSDVLKQEKGFVFEKHYNPNTLQTSTGVGYSTSGNVVMTSHTTGESEKFTVIFECEHKVLFSVNDASIYMKFAKGDTVLIDYYEILEDGSNRIVDYEFVNASPIKK